jgi:hypothetical protein
VKTTAKIVSVLSLMAALVAAPALLVTKAQAASTYGYYAGGGYTNGYYHGPRDGQCWNNKRGC